MVESLELQDYLCFPHTFPSCWWGRWCWHEHSLKCSVRSLWVAAGHWSCRNQSKWGSLPGLLPVDSIKQNHDLELLCVLLNNYRLKYCGFSSAWTIRYLEGELVLLLVGERNILGHHLSQVILHKIHCEAEPLFDLIPGGAIIVIAE